MTCRSLFLVDCGVLRGKTTSLDEKKPAGVHLIFSDLNLNKRSPISIEAPNYKETSYKNSSTSPDDDSVLILASVEERFSKSLYDGNKKVSELGEGLAKRNSKINGAGYGLFATKKFEQAEVLCEYAGYHVTCAPDEIKGNYILETFRHDGDRQIVDEKIEHLIDAQDRSSSSLSSVSLGGLINNSSTPNAAFAYGLLVSDIKSSTPELLKKDPVFLRCFVVALRTIEPDEEIYVNYGGKYNMK